MKKFLALLVTISLICLPAFAETTAQLGGMDSSGNYYWIIDDDGTLIGATGAEISLGGEEKSSWGDIISPMTDQDGYTTTTDAGSKLKLHDDGDLTLGGAQAADVVITWDSDSNDYYVGVNDTENELQIGYGSAIGTTEQISIKSDATIMLGEDTDVDFGLIFQSGAQDYYQGIDYTGGVEEDVLTFGRGSTIGATPELAIGATAVYVNHLDAPGNVDLDIGSADVDDVTITTDGGTLILDGTITLTDAEIISNPTDDTVRIESDSTDITLEVYGIADKDAILALTADASADNGDDWSIKNDDADSNNLIFQNDTTGSAATKLTVGKTGIVTTTNYIDNKITDTTTSAVVDVVKLTHDGGTAAAGVGTGLVFQVDDAGGIEEQGSIDVSLSTVTDAAEDADLVISLNNAGTMREALKIDTDVDATHAGVLEYTSWTLETNDVVDVLELKLDNTADTSIDNFGMGLSFQLEDETDAVEEQASLDFILTDAGSTTEDCDVVLSQNVAGAITERVRFDADGANILLSGATPSIIIGDDGAEDTSIVFDGNAKEYYVGIDDVGSYPDDLVIGMGSAVGTTAAIAIDENQHVAFVQEVTVADALTLSAELVLSNETVTCTAGDPQGTGTADPDKTITFIVTNATGSSYDLVTLADGSTGDVKVFTYKTDLETTGVAVQPTNLADSTNILFEDAGDGCTMIFDGTNWSVVSNNGGTLQ